MAIKLSARKSPRAERNGGATTMRDDVRAFKRELILNTAIDIFFDKGYQNSTVDDIAAAMSVTKAVIYYNFTSKEEVLENIIDRTAGLTHECVDRGITVGKTPAQKLALVCYFYADHILRHQKMIAVYFREERNFSAALRRRMTILEKSVDEKISAILEAGAISGEFLKGDTRLGAITLMGMISMAFHWYRETGRVSREGLCRHFADQALRLVAFEGDLGLDDAAFKLKPESD
jgi:TetR/AcrR family transcriptional regulator, cholesterol catabolism regulator